MREDQLDRSVSLIYDLLFGYTDKMKNLRKHLEQGEFYLPVQRAMVVKFRDFQEIKSELAFFARSELEKRVINLLQKVCEGFTEDILLDQVDEDSFVLFFGQVSSVTAFARSIKEILEKETEYLYIIGIGRNYSNIKGLISSYHEARKACYQASFHGKDIVVAGEFISLSHEIPLFLSRLEEKLIQKLKLKELSEVDHFFRQFLQATMEELLEPDAIKIRLLNFSTRVMRTIKAEEGYSFLSYMEQILVAETRDELIDLSLDFFHKILSFLKVDKQDLKIKKALLYIEKNYYQQLSLQEVADKAGLSQYYFSHLFKQEVGESFISYINKLRIEAAKKLLLDTSLDVGEICYHVGFNDPNYFTRVFKEYEDITPSRFRSNYV